MFQPPAERRREAFRPQERLRIEGRLSSTFPLASTPDILNWAAFLLGGKELYT